MCQLVYKIGSQSEQGAECVRACGFPHGVGQGCEIALKCLVFKEWDAAVCCPFEGRHFYSYGCKQFSGRLGVLSDNAVQAVACNVLVRGFQELDEHVDHPSFPDFGHLRHGTQTERGGGDEADTDGYGECCGHFRVVHGGQQMADVFEFLSTRAGLEAGGHPFPECAAFECLSGREGQLFAVSSKSGQERE